MVLRSSYSTLNEGTLSQFLTKSKVPKKIMRHMRMDGMVNKPSQDTVPLMILSRPEKTYLSSRIDYAG